jgi:hypothetical protein
MGISAVSSIDTTYSIRLDEASSTELYVGEAPIGGVSSSAVWRIKKLVTSGSTLSVLWADGNQAFDNIWDNRLSLSYT